MGRPLLARKQEEYLFQPTLGILMNPSLGGYTPVVGITSGGFHGPHPMGGGGHHTLFLFPPVCELAYLVQKVIWEGGKGVTVEAVRKREK